MDFSGSVMGTEWKDDLAGEESSAAVMDASWGVIMADTEISPISVAAYEIWKHSYIKSWNPLL